MFKCLVWYAPPYTTIVTGSFLYWFVMRLASQRFFIHSCIYLRILIISYLATFLFTNSLSVLMWRKAVNQSTLVFLDTNYRALIWSECCCDIIRDIIWNNTNTLVKAFTMYVRPLLEYASCLWAPCSIVNIKKVEICPTPFYKEVA